MPTARYSVNGHGEGFPPPRWIVSVGYAKWTGPVGTDRAGVCPRRRTPRSMIYARYHPATARRIACRLEWVHTNMHGPWLHTADFEINVLNLQASARLKDAGHSDYRPGMTTVFNWELRELALQHRIMPVSNCRHCIHQFKQFGTLAWGPNVSRCGYCNDGTCHCKRPVLRLTFFKPAEADPQSVNAKRHDSHAEEVSKKLQPSPGDNWRNPGLFSQT